jgi:membrane-bound ClpP family serine protease
MKHLGRLITGIVISIIGFILVLIPFFNLKLFFIWIYGIPIFIIGLIILFNKKEDKIEQIRKK